MAEERDLLLSDMHVCWHTHYPTALGEVPRFTPHLVSLLSDCEKHSQSCQMKNQTMLPKICRLISPRICGRFGKQTTRKLNLVLHFLLK